MLAGRRTQPMRVQWYEWQNLPSLPKTLDPDAGVGCWLCSFASCTSVGAHEMFHKNAVSSAASKRAAHRGLVAQPSPCPLTLSRNALGSVETAP